MKSSLKYSSLILSISLMAAPLPVLAAKSHDTKAENIRAELANKKAEHEALQKKSNALNSEVSSLKKNLVSVSKNLRESEEELSATDQSLKDLRKRKQQVVEVLYKDQKAMGGLVSAAKKYSQTSTPDMLVQSDPVDAARAATIMKSIMPRLQEQSATLKGTLAELQKIEDDITRQLRIQKEQNNKLNKQQDDLGVLLQQRRQLYKATESERQAQEKEVARLTREARNLDDLMAKLKSRPEKSPTRKGGNLADSKAPTLPFRMTLPVSGKVYTAFGQEDDLGAPSKGITFSTRSGGSVVAPLAGTVKFAGPFQRYKQILIVEHKGGYHSLIAGLARIDTVVGASLAAGEPVGVAETSSEPHIYYELRQNGKPINPQKSLLAQKKQEKS